MERLVISHDVEDFHRDGSRNQASCFLGGVSLGHQPIHGLPRLRGVVVANLILNDLQNATAQLRIGFRKFHILWRLNGST